MFVFLTVALCTSTERATAPTGSTGKPTGSAGTLTGSAAASNRSALEPMLIHRAVAFC